MIRAFRPKLPSEAGKQPTSAVRRANESTIALIAWALTTCFIAAVMFGESQVLGDTSRQVAILWWEFRVDDWIGPHQFLHAAVAIEVIAALAIVTRWSLCVPTGSRTSRWLAVVLAGCMFGGGALSIARNPILRPQAADVRDDFNYLLGTKYFREVGYTRLYQCAVVTQLDRGHDSIEWVRSLKTSHIYPASQIAKSDRIRSRCRKRFSSERWEQFSSDVEQFRVWIEPWAGQWPRMFGDHGFNGPPTLAQFLSLVSNIVPITHTGLSLLGLINLAFVAFMLWLVRWAFRWEAMCAYGVVFFCSNFEAFGHNMSIPRYGWLTAIVAGICCVRRQRYATAAVALVIAAALKGFPGVFLVAACLAIGLRAWRPAARRFRLSPAHRRFLIAMLISGTVLGILSVSTHHGFGNWRGFLHQMSVNGARRAPGCIGFIYNFFYPATAKFDDAKAALDVAIGPLKVSQIAWILAAAIAAAIARHGRWCNETVFVLGFGFALLHLFTAPVPYYYAGFIGMPLLFAGGRGSNTWRASVVTLLAIDLWANVLTPHVSHYVLGSTFLSLACTAYVIGFLFVLEHQKRACSRGCANQAG